MNRRKKGSDYEEIAAEYLQGQGYRILERNFRSRRGEIDLIAEQGSQIVFVEVKYRQNQQKGSPLEVVDSRKQQRIVMAARYYLYLHRMPEDVSCRFDVIGITGTQMEHIKNAFEAGS